MPKKVGLHDLKKVIGEENTKKLYDAFAGMNIYMPKKGIKFSNQKEKEQYIRNLYFHAGKSVQYIANNVDLSIDRIRKIICNRDNKN